MKISCIVPVYNNETTLQHVLSVLVVVDEINEIIVGDDASSDNSYEVAKGFGSQIKLFRNEKNLGKGGNVVKGVKMSKGDVLFFCDADLSRLNKKHVLNLIHTFRDGNYDMVIGARKEDSKTPIIGKFLETVSGERILKRKNIEEYLDLISNVGNGIEQITNFAHRKKKVKMIINEGTGHIIKAQRKNKVEATREYVQEIGQIVKTDVKLKRKLMGAVRIVGVVAVLSGVFSLWFFNRRKAIAGEVKS